MKAVDWVASSGVLCDQPFGAVAARTPAQGSPGFQGFGAAEEFRANGRRAVMVAPWPGLETMVSWPP